MAKFRSPLEVLLITQTYHTGSNNTAVDFSAKVEDPVYAIADGTITYRDSTLGSYCVQTLSNSVVPKVYYTHTYKWASQGVFVKKGELIARVAPTSLNGGHPTHLHLGLTIGFNLMDYMDRSLDFKAGFTWGSKDNLAIRNAWFNGGSQLNWALFKDLSYQNTTMAFKKGDKIEFTGVQNMRKGSGTSYPVTGSTAVGMLSIIEDGPRVADGYTWWDLNNGDWVADVSKFKLYVKPVEPPVDPQPTECEKQVIVLKEENRLLKLTTGAQEVQIEQIQTDAKIKEQELEKKVLEWKEMYTTCKADLEQAKKNFIKKILEAIEKWLGITIG